MSDEATVIETGGADDLAGVQEEGQQQQEVTPKAEAKPAEWQTAIADLARTVKEGQPKAVAKEPTQEEKDEFWAIYNPEKSNPDFFKKWMRLAADANPNEVQTSVAERKALFAEMQQGLVKQAVVGSRNLFMQELQKLREEFNPITEHVTQQRNEATRSRFFDTYPALATKTAEGKQQFAKIIDATARTMGDKTFSSEEEYFKALAESAAETIKGVIPDFDLGAKTTKPAVTSPRLPRTSVGGTGGSGSGGTGKKVTSDDDADTINW